MATKFNDEQLRAIASKSREILVSAGAGSGKSTVLVERLMRQMIQDKKHVDQFLIVTFTHLAAREMAEKLRLRLNSALAENPHAKHLQQQLYKIAYAHISTFHGFCHQILKRYYYLVDLDVQMQLMDEMEAVMLRADVLDELMNDMYEDERFRLLVDVFGTDRSDEALADLLMKVYEIARANPEMESWLSDLSQLYNISGETVDGWAFYSHVKAWISPLLDAAAGHVLAARDLAQAAEMTEVAHGYVGMFGQDLAVIDALRTSLEGGTYDEVRKILAHTQLGNFPMRSKKMSEHWDEGLHNRAKAARNEFKGILDTLSKDFFAYRNESHVGHFARGAQIVQALAELVLIFHERFSAKKRAQAKVDFSDLERLTLKILRSNPEVLGEIAAGFNEIMIDEYQDTNDMQERIIKLISDAGHVPLFMVGDVKQSIYRFRLAEPSIFQGKYAAYQLSHHVGEKIDLKQNYRSSRDVIDATNYMFERLMDREVGEIDYDEEARGVLGIHEANDAFNVPELHLINKEALEETDQNQNMNTLSEAELEAHHVAQQIKKMVDEQAQLYVRGVGHRPVTYDDIVILMRSMGASTTFYNILTQYQIPVFTEQAGDLLVETEIMTMLALLSVIDNPYQDIPLVAAMRSPLFFFTEPELAQIRASNKAASFYEALKTFVTTGADTALHLKGQGFLSKLKNWRYESRFSTVANMLRQIYEQTAYYDFVLGLAGGQMRRANLDLLEEVADAYETRTKKGLYAFLRHLDDLQRLGKSIPKAKPAAARGEHVKIMTIHKSKGLEFPIIFVVNLQKKFNTQDEMGNYVLHKNHGIGVQYINPDLRLKQKTLVTTMLAKMLHQEMLAEEMRLLYVALTRAKSKLVLTGVMKDHEAIDKLVETDIAPAHVRLAAHRYLDWVLPIVADKQAANPWQWQIITEMVARPPERHDQSVIPKTPPVIHLEAVLNRVYRFEELTTILAKQSVSQRKAEETLPLYQGIPEPIAAASYERPSFIQDVARATEIGTAFHQLMQHLPIQAGHTLASITRLKNELVDRQLIKPQLASRVNLVDIYQFTTSDSYRQLLRARKIQKELPFTTLIQAGMTKQAKAMLQGVIDLLAEFDDEVWIVDYKTDRVTDFNRQQMALRNRYDVQMKYYLQAMRHLYPDKQVTAHVYFMGVGKKVVYR